MATIPRSETHDLHEQDVVELESQLFALTLDDKGPDLDSHSRLWSSRADFQGAKETDHVLPSLNELPLEHLISGAHRLSINDSAPPPTFPASAPSPSIPSQTTPNPPSKAGRLRIRSLRVLAAIQDHVRSLSYELSQPQGEAGIKRIESLLAEHQRQVEKVPYKSVSKEKNLLLNELRRLFVLCAARHIDLGENAEHPVEVNTGENNLSCICLRG